MTRPAPSLFNQPIGDELDWLAGLLARARRNASELSDSDIRFVDDMTLRLDRYDAGTFVSDRQRKWLKDIERRLDGAGVPADPDDPGEAMGGAT